MKRLAVGLFLLIALGTDIVLLPRLGGEASAEATVTVNTTADELNSDGDCSLREAIQAANTDAVVDGCIAGSGADTIILPAGTYTLSIAGAGEDANATGDLDITDDLTIDGAGQASTIIDGGALDRVLHTVVVVEISGVTIQNGHVTGTGAGIFNGGTLTLNNSTVSGNTAPTPGLLGGGIYTDGTLTLNNSTVSGNSTIGGGGGILNVTLGVVTLNNSTVSGNTAGEGWGGGGIASDGPLTLNNSTISGNSAGTTGGGIWNYGSGTVELRNSTVSANSAGDGGGIFNQGASTLKNTIVANGSPNDCSGAVTSAGHNLDSDGTCGLGATGDLPSTDPQLDPLANNGGPTQTHALQTGSPAIDAGDNSGCPATDQRGFLRPVDGDDNGSAICDIGAYEFGASPPVPVGGIAELPDVRSDSGLSAPNYIALAGLAAAALVAAGAGAWYARRRFSRG